MTDDRSSTIADLVGAVTAAIAGLPVILTLVERPDLTATPRYGGWLALFVLFVVGCWLHKTTWSRRRVLAWMAAMSLAAVAMNALVPVTLHGVLLVIVAGMLGFTLEMGWAVVWIAVQTGAFLWPFARATQSEEVWIMALAFFGFQFFALYAATAVQRERRARDELATANAELLATRRRLADSSRAEERLRISRDLHDVLGHHLTALSLHLETARHAEGDKAEASLEVAHGITRRLLGEVRQVVGRLRDDAPLDLRAELAGLAAGIDRPVIHLEVPGTFPALDDPRRAEALLRSAQEIVTNAVRHADAENLWLRLAGTDDGIELVARDDGRGPAVGSDAAGTDGHGLAGMAERLERLGGRLAVGGAPGEGFSVHVWLPSSVDAGAVP
jgi:signal transduction histidine kinase